MKLTRLDLKAFGSFTDRILEFNSAKPGLHIIYGSNEAGKSTSLRALKALLYGFPERTSDNFIHANPQLLVGGCLEGTDGQKLTFLRRKKRKGDLLDLDGNPIDPGTLASFLHGIEPALFESLYGIDHATLVEGGEDILAQKGEVGQALFAAGAGISSLKKILDALDTEADELFKARGAKQQINQAVKEYKELKKDLKDASLPAGRWKEHTKNLQDAEEKLAELEQERRQKDAEIRRLERLNRAIPELAALENLQKQLREVGEVVVLPPEFAQQLQQVEQSIRETRLQIEKDKDRLQKLRKKQKNISPNQPLLDHAETIEDLHQRLGKYRKDQKDRDRIDGMRISNRKDAGALIEEIRPDLKLEDADSLRPVLSKKRTIQDLSSRHEALAQQAAQARKQRDTATGGLQQIAEVLSTLPPLRKNDALAKAVKAALRIGDIDQQIEEISREIDAGKKSCQTELTRLGLWSGEPAQLLKLTLPLPETLHRFEADFGELDKQKQQLKKERRKAKAELKAAGTDQNEVLYGGEVPAEHDLTQSRQKRQDGWQLLRRQWIDSEDISGELEDYAPDLPLHEAYEKNVTRADHIADRLRREAERVARAASLRARIESLEESIREIDQMDQEVIEKEKELTAGWRAEWKSAGITPLTPQEMLPWLTAMDTLRSKVTETRNKENELADKETSRRQYRTALLAEMGDMGEDETFSGRTLGPVLLFAESVGEDIARHKMEREKLSVRQDQAQKALDRGSKELAEAENAEIEWRKKWEKALEGLGLADQISPSEALDLLDTINACFDKLAKAVEFQSRIDGINRDEAAFSTDVQAMLQLTAPDLGNLSPDQAALQMHTMLGKARQNNELLKKNTEEIETLTTEIEGAEKTLQSLDKQLGEFMATAGCTRAADLAEAIRKHGEHQRLQDKISDAASSMARVSEGVPLEDIKRQAEAVNVDDLPGQITALQRQIDEELAPGIKELSERIGEENKELQLMDGSGRAAEAAEKMEQVAARIRRLVEQYTRIRLAAMVLRGEIERYREEHQDPVLQIASKFFSQLTTGSFAGLRTDVNDNGNPILVGVRPDDSRLTVEAMSSGTRDQLFLALRLATLEWRLETSEPIPFIVDDILINFDDERSRATLEILANLADKNQVILFTHHRQVVDEAAKLKNNKPVFVYEL